MKEKIENRYLVLSEIFFCAFVFLKQFYLFPSGSIGISDIFLMSSTVIVFINSVMMKRERILIRYDLYWYLFIIFVTIINGYYFARTKNSEFLRYIVYWIYCTMAIWTFRKLAREHFFYKVSIVCRINIILQVVIYCLGLGRYYHEGWGGGRFMGTFNDPNQCAFFILTMLLFLFMYQHGRFTFEFGIFLTLCIFIIYVAKSTGMFLGIFIFCFLFVLQKTLSKYRVATNKKIWNLFFFVGILIICFGIYKIWPEENFDITQSGYTLMSRIQQKTWKFSQGNFADFLYDRSAERLVQYPQYLIFGAGEGGFERFPLGEFVNKISPGVFVMEFTHEIHSSLFEVWFCYGIVPTTVLTLWVIKNIKLCDKKLLIAVIAILVESFFLMNCRQPFFWYIIIYSSTLELINRGEMEILQ